jgi:hypothetical protein
MIDPSQFPDLGDWVPIHRKKLMDLVAKTPLSMNEFERIIGWDFIRDAPQKKKDLAWALLNIGDANLKIMSELRKAFPNAYITEIRDVSHAAVHDELGAPRPDVGT